MRRCDIVLSLRRCVVASLHRCVADTCARGTSHPSSKAVSKSLNSPWALNLPLSLSSRSGISLSIDSAVSSDWAIKAMRGSKSDVESRPTLYHTTPTSSLPLRSLCLPRCSPPNRFSYR
jgi:hypothetical protein